MSGNAALQAARRRRNPVEVPEPMSDNMEMLDKNVKFSDNNDFDESLKKNRDNSNPQTIRFYVNEHDKAIFLLERKVELLLQKAGDTDTNELTNLTQSNNTELKLLKTTLTKQQKQLSDLSNLVTTLRATLANQNNQIEDLLTKVDNSRNSTTDVSVNTEVNEMSLNSK
tara:strand:+ start:753 stop:1259 length:507 start_codon:yes stop_codon:yes gene_type:complete